MLTPLLMCVLAVEPTIEAKVRAAAPDVSLDVLIAEAATQRTVVLGETHRTDQPLHLLRALLPRLKAQAHFTHLAFEAQEDNQVAVDQFQAGFADAGVLERVAYTPLMSQVMQEAHQLGYRLMLIDGPSKWNVDTLEQTRDQRMFAHVRRVLDTQPAARVILFVGNTHTTEKLLMNRLAEGPGHRSDALRFQGYTVAHLLDLYTGGRSLSIVGTCCCTSTARASRQTKA